MCSPQPSPIPTTPRARELARFALEALAELDLGTAIAALTELSLLAAAVRPVLLDARALEDRVRTLAADLERAMDDGRGEIRAALEKRLAEIEDRQRDLGWRGPENETLRVERERLIADLRDAGGEWLS